jgi:hypothetical protein
MTDYLVMWRGTPDSIVCFKDGLAFLLGAAAYDHKKPGPL